MIASLPDELLMNIRECSKNQDWKYLMDTSYGSFRDLKYRTIKVYVVFRKLNDRVLPPIVSKLIDPLKQLYLYLETEGSAEWKDDEFEVTGVRTKRSWEHPVQWRSTNIVTVKDVKWFLSIPAKYLYWSGGDPLISENPILMKALRKYEVLILEWQHYYEINLPYHYLNHSNHIKYLTIRGSWNFKAPILPSLIELELKNIMGEEDLTNLIYSLSLEEIILDHEEYIKTILIPNQVMERGVEIIQSNILDVVEVDATMCNKNDDDHDDDSYEEDESNDDDTIDIYDEEEVTEYSSEGDEEDEWN